MQPSDAPTGSMAPAPSRPLRLVHVSCGVCGSDDPEPVAVGEDFEYRTSDDTFLMVRCRSCGLFYLNPRPAEHEAERIYPASCRAGEALSARHRWEARRLLRSCRSLPARARILHVGCGDGFHLDLLRACAPAGLRFEGVESDRGAVAAARARGLMIHAGTLAEAVLETAAYDLAFVVGALELSSDPGALLARTRQVLRPGGTLVIVTENAGSLVRRVFGARYWGGYRFPRTWNLFTNNSLTRLAAGSGLHVKSSATSVSPFGWMFSIRNALLDARAPGWLVEPFGHGASVPRAFFTLLDTLGRRAGGASLLCVELERPAC
jgi:SAM-dependent methyltransferase